MKVLFVCTGNTCRSPMLRFMFEDYLLRRGVANISVDCAGLLKQNQAISDEAVKVLKAHGVDCDASYTSKYCDVSIASNADIIICVTRECAELLKEQYPTMQGVISLLDLGVEVVQDPYGQGVEAYGKAYKIFEKSLPKILEYIYPTN